MFKRIAGWWREYRDANPDNGPISAAIILVLIAAAFVGAFVFAVVGLDHFL